MVIHIIWAQDNNSGIGKNDKLPWHIPEDLKNFKNITKNNTIIMGRKTWDSLPIKPLPNRKNIVLSRKKIKNVECYNSITNCLKSIESENNVFIIGGGEIYKQFFDYAKYLHITFIDSVNDDIDTFFPISMDVIKENYIEKEFKYIADKVKYSCWIRKTPS